MDAEESLLQAEDQPQRKHFENIAARGDIKYRSIYNAGVSDKDFGEIRSCDVHGLGTSAETKVLVQH